MLFKILFFIQISHSFQYIIERKCDDYYCTSDPWKCVLKGFNNVEDIEEFCNRRSFFEYTDPYGNINTASGSQFQIIEFQDVSMTRLPTACFSKFSSIRELYANNTGIEKINSDDFQNLRSYLQILNLSGNKIKTFENSSFQYFNGLLKIDLSFNNIEIIHENIFDEMGQSVSDLDLSHNQLQQFNEQILQKFFGTKYFNAKISLSNNKIENFIPTKTICQMANGNNYYTEVNISHNSLKSIESKCDFAVLDISNNQIDEVNSNAKEIIADNNQIKSVTVSENIKRVSLKNNNLQMLDDYVSFFSTLTNVTELDISNNTFKHFKLESFAEMKKLTKLSMTQVGLTQIPFGLFAHSKNVETLDLSNNNLKSTLDLLKFSAMDNLQTLNISGNNLSRLENYGILKKINPSLQYIGLEGNDWKCIYLSFMKISFNENGIRLIDPVNPVKNETNNFGIKCYEPEDSTNLA